MRFQFTKMHGTGNDFMVIDRVRQKVVLTPEDVRTLADRQRGVGFDQLLLVEPPHDSANDFRYRIFNADGGEVEQCGNGARCFARFVLERGLTLRHELRVETARGVIFPRVESDGEVSVDMGAPHFAPGEVPFLADAQAPVHALDVAGKLRMVSVLSMGNPHAVQFVTDLDAAPVASEGPLIERHTRFPQRANAGYAQVLSRERIRLRVWERGAGETLACGTGACAAVVAGIRRGLLADSVAVEMRGGVLRISWQGDPHSVWMRGPAVTVFDGEIEMRNGTSPC
jgi:diaminopimelate epimerase